MHAARAQYKHKQTVNSATENLNIMIYNKHIIKFKFKSIIHSYPVPVLAKGHERVRVTV